jgi:hypothetical protein
MKRKGRRRLPKVRARYDRGGRSAAVRSQGRIAGDAGHGRRPRRLFGAFLAVAFVVLLVILIIAT